jgi:hypothetical protein
MTLEKLVQVPGAVNDWTGASGKRPVEKIELDFGVPGFVCCMGWVAMGEIRVATIPGPSMRPGWESWPPISDRTLDAWAGRGMTS